MARSGRFGRLPRRAPDLSSSIVALMREYWNNQEQIMVDAWKEGGQVDGQPVTDSRLLKFWQDRRDSMSRDDPLWDHYNNLYQQYDFSIEESKVGLKYAQKKMSAREVAQWYKEQATKYVPDSEVYRTIMGQAARFLDAARANTRASNTERRQKAYVRVRDTTYKDELFPSMYVTQGLAWVFRNMGYLNGSQNFTQTQGDESQMPVLGEGDQLTQLSYQNGGAQMWDTVLSIINDPTNPLHQVFQDNFVTPAERQGLTLDLPLDQQDLEALLTRSMTGYDHLIAVDKKFDDVAPASNASKLRDQQLATLDTFQYLFTLDEEAIYAQRRKTFVDSISAPGATIFDQLNALSAYRTGLNGLSAQTGDQNPVFNTALTVELRYLNGDAAGGGPTIAEDALLSPFGITSRAAGTDAAAWSGLVNNLNDVVTALTTGGAVAVDRDPATNMWVALTPAQLAIKYPDRNYILIPHSANASTVAVPTDAGQRVLGRSTPTATPISYGEIIVAKPIVVTVGSDVTVDPNTGRPTGPAIPAAVPGRAEADTNIGLVATIPDATGGPGTKVYGIYVGGQVRWTTVSPFAATATLGAGEDGPAQLTIHGSPTFPGVGFRTPDDKPYFDPQGVIDHTLFTSDSTQSFIDPAIAVMASTPSGRHTVATMDPTTLLRTLQVSPWINWQDPTQANEVWQDIGAIIRSDSGTNTAAGYTAEYNFYRAMQQARGIPGSSPFAPGGILDPNAFAVQTYMNTGVQVPGVTSLPGYDQAVQQRAADDRFASDAREASVQRALAAQTSQPLPPGTAVANAMPQSNPFAAANPFGTGLPSQWFQGTVFGPQAQNYGQPTVQQSGQITMPNMPGWAPAYANPTATPTPYTPPAPTPPPVAPPPPPPNLPPPPGPPPYAGGACFVAGVMITTPSGSRPIEDMTAGDEVLGYDEDTGEFTLGEVTRTHLHRADTRQRVVVHFEHGPGIEATENHPFFSPREAIYKPLGTFTVGDEVLSASGKKAIVSMEMQPINAVDLFNLTVSRVQTYIANGVVVHNKPLDQIGQ